LVLYNTDYDDELKAESGADVSAVEEAARAVAAAVAAAGFDSDILGVHGDDLDRVFRRLADRPPDLVFNLVESLRGTTRNEPLMAALLELLEIPFTGPGPMPLRLCLHKDRARQILEGAGVTIPEGFVITSRADLDPERLAGLAYPMFLKLSREDASIGIEASNVATDPGGLARRAAQLLDQYRQPLIAERFIDGREVNVTVIGNPGSLEVLPLHEIDFGAMPDGSPHIISYAAKWDDAHPDYAGTLPVPLRDPDPALAALIESVSRAAFEALELADYARVDLRIDAAGKPHVIDVNPNCDLSPGAGVARAAAAGGLEYPRLIGRICEIAWRRHVHRHPRHPAR
jgi:D-alanine-D-alanine ligase